MKQINRRQFVISAAALTAAPSALVSGSALAAAQVDPDGPAAKALQYVHVSPNAETPFTTVPTPADHRMNRPSWA